MTSSHHHHQLDVVFAFVGNVNINDAAWYVAFQAEMCCNNSPQSIFCYFEQIAATPFSQI
jgi:hypothetical protein